MDYIISDRLYTVLKWAGVIVFPALATFVGTVAPAWGMDAALSDAIVTTQIYAMYSAGGCISFITEEEYGSLMQNLGTMITVADTPALRAARVIMGNTAPLAEDSQGRFTLPADLKEMAALGRDVIFVGMGNKIELWDPQRFEDNISGVDYDYYCKDKFAAINGEIIF